MSAILYEGGKVYATITDTYENGAVSKRVSKAPNNSGKTTTTTSTPMPDQPIVPFTPGLEVRTKEDWECIIWKPWTPPLDPKTKLELNVAMSSIQKHEDAVVSMGTFSSASIASMIGFGDPEVMQALTTLDEQNRGEVSLYTKFEADPLEDKSYFYVGQDKESGMTASEFNFRSCVNAVLRVNSGCDIDETDFKNLTIYGKLELLEKALTDKVFDRLKELSNNTNKIEQYDCTIGEFIQANYSTLLQTATVTLDGLDINDVIKKAADLAHEILEELSIYRQRHDLDSDTFTCEGSCCEFLDLIDD